MLDDLKIAHPNSCKAHCKSQNISCHQNCPCQPHKDRDKDLVSMLDDLKIAQNKRAQTGRVRGNQLQDVIILQQQNIINQQRTIIQMLKGLLFKLPFQKVYANKEIETPATTTTTTTATTTKEKTKRISKIT